jgi:undecaprenyl-diphosphatase
MSTGRPRARDSIVMAATLSVVVAGAVAARRPPVRSTELRWFRAVNGLPAAAYVPLWALMQSGSLAGALATSGAVAATGRPRLGRRMAASVAVAWLAAKAIKPFVQRGRPAGVLDMVRVLGREQSGLGYPSGHAAVAAALAAAASPDLSFGRRAWTWAGAAGVAAARVYVGAHLPLDVVGGAALGTAVGTASRLVTRPRGARLGSRRTG